MVGTSSKRPPKAKRDLNQQPLGLEATMLVLIQYTQHMNIRQQREHPRVVESIVPSSKFYAVVIMQISKDAC